MDSTSKMQVNVEKSRVMWFSVKSSKSPSPTAVAPILLEGTPLMNVSKQKYLGITIESDLDLPCCQCLQEDGILSMCDRLSSEDTS